MKTTEEVNLDSAVRAFKARPTPANFRQLCKTADAFQTRWCQNSMAWRGDEE